MGIICCGWTGVTAHPTGDYESAGYQAAETEWGRELLGLLIGRAQAAQRAANDLAEARRR